MNTDGLPTGRELDLAIAQAVAGIDAYLCHTEAGGKHITTPFGVRHVAPVDPYHDSACLDVLDYMADRGYHARVQTPFEPGQPYFCGFTPHGVTGWNGRPDYEAGADSLGLAICWAALATVRAQPSPAGRR